MQGAIGGPEAEHLEVHSCLQCYSMHTISLYKLALCHRNVTCTYCAFVFPFHIELIDLFIFTVYMNLDIYGSSTGQSLDTTRWA